MLRRVIAALDASVAIEVRWRAGALDRLLMKRRDGPAVTSSGRSAGQFVRVHLFGLGAGLDRILRTAGRRVIVS